MSVKALTGGVKVLQLDTSGLSITAAALQSAGGEAAPLAFELAPPHKVRASALQSGGRAGQAVGKVESGEPVKEGRRDGEGLTFVQVVSVARTIPSRLPETPGLTRAACLCCVPGQVTQRDPGCRPLNFWSVNI